MLEKKKKKRDCGCGKCVDKVIEERVKRDMICGPM